MQPVQKENKFIYESFVHVILFIVTISSFLVAIEFVICRIYFYLKSLQ